MSGRSVAGVRKASRTTAGVTDEMRWRWWRRSVWSVEPWKIPGRTVGEKGKHRVGGLDDLGLPQHQRRVYWSSSWWSMAGQCPRYLCSGGAVHHRSGTRASRAAVVPQFCRVRRMAERWGASHSAVLDLPVRICGGSGTGYGGRQRPCPYRPVSRPSVSKVGWQEVRTRQAEDGWRARYRAGQFPAGRTLEGLELTETHRPSVGNSPEWQHPNAVPPRAPVETGSWC